MQAVEQLKPLWCTGIASHVISVSKATSKRTENPNTHAAGAILTALCKKGLETGIESPVA